VFKHLFQITKEGIIYGLGGVAARMVTFFLVPIYTRFFSTEDYGVISLLTSSFQLVQIISILALDSASWRWFYDTESEQDRKKTIASWAWTSLFCSTLICVIVVLNANWLSKLILGNSSAGIYIRLLGFSLPFTVLSYLLSSWFRLARKPTSMVIFILFSSLATIGLTILFVIPMHTGILGIYTAQLIVAVISALATIWLMKDWLNPRYLDFSRLREMFRYAYPLIPASISTWIITLSSLFFVQHYSNLSSVGVYRVGATIAMFVSLIVTAFQQTWAPYSISIYKNPEANKFYALVFQIYIWGTSVFSVFLALFGPEIIRLFATENYLNASPVISILAFGYIFVGLKDIAIIGPAIGKTMRHAGQAIVISGVLNIVLNFLLIPQWGTLGAAISTLVAQAIVPVYIFYFGQKIYPIPYRFTPALITLGIAFFCPYLFELLPISIPWLSILVRLGILAILLPLPLVLRVTSIPYLKSIWVSFQNDFLRGSEKAVPPQG
jgi:O-antigen/teichoic acid export membrane protein